MNNYSELVNKWAQDIVYYTGIKMKGLYQYTKATINHVYDVMDSLYN